MDVTGVATMDLLGMFLGFVLTLSVFSYIFGDNFLFRLVVHIFIGVAAGFAAVVVFYSVIWHQLIIPLLGEAGIGLWVLLILSILLFAKAFPRFSGLGSPVIAYLVGVGAAAAIGGAILGTTLPQVTATVNGFDLQLADEGGQSALVYILNGSVFLIGTLTTLAYFHYGRQRGHSATKTPWIESISWIGQVFISVTLGVLFAGVFAASLTAMIERWDFIVGFILDFILP